MVQIINYKECKREDGTSFYMLELQGGLEMTLSKTTGQYYATAKKAYISSTFDEATCKGLIGTQMQGSITKQECEPYTYLVKETGEELVLSHHWVFIPNNEEVKQEKAINKLMVDTSVFSQNGASQLAEETF